MSLQTTLEKLNETIDDLSSLQVQTFTGTISFNLSDQDTDAQDTDDQDTNGANLNKKYSNIYETIKNAHKGGDITLVAESFYKFDGDSYNFLTSDANVPPKALELHTSAVQSGLETRQALINMAKNALGF